MTEDLAKKLNELKIGSSSHKCKISQNVLTDGQYNTSEVTKHSFQYPEIGENTESVYNTSKCATCRLPRGSEKFGELHSRKKNSISNSYKREGSLKLEDAHLSQTLKRIPQDNRNLRLRSNILQATSNHVCDVCTKTRNSAFARGKICPVSFHSCNPVENSAIHNSSGDELVNVPENFHNGKSFYGPLHKIEKISDCVASRAPLNTCSQQASTSGQGQLMGSLYNTSASAAIADDVTIDELASYFETLVHIPKKMSTMAEMMYI